MEQESESKYIEFVQPSAGLYDISMNQYHRLAVNGFPVLSRSQLMRIDDCPAALFVEHEETPAQLRGQAFHCMLLEGAAEFDARFAVWGGPPRNTKAGKDEWADFQVKNIGKAVIPRDDYDDIIAAAISVSKHPFASILTSQPSREKSAIWQHKETNLWIKTRPDLAAEGKGTLMDIKYMADVSEHGVERSIRSYGIDIQAALAIDGMKETTGEEFDKFLLITICPDKPHRCEVYELDENWISYGRMEYNRLLRIAAQCKEANHWPAYQNAGNQIVLMPAWLEQRWEGRGR